MVSSTGTVVHSLGAIDPRCVVGTGLVKDLVGVHRLLGNRYEMWMMVTLPEQNLFIVVVADGEGVVIAKVVVAVRHGDSEVAR